MIQHVPTLPVRTRAVLRLFKFQTQLFENRVTDQTFKTPLPSIKHHQPSVVFYVKLVNQPPERYTTPPKHFAEPVNWNWRLQRCHALKLFLFVGLEPHTLAWLVAHPLYGYFGNGSNANCLVKKYIFKANKSIVSI